MNKFAKIRIALYAFILLLGIIYPVWQIIRMEQAEGAVTMRFQVKGYDPEDVFRGKYLRFSIPMNYADSFSDEPTAIRRTSVVYAVLGTDGKGFATVLRLVSEIEEGNTCLKLESRHYPFNRFFINEDDVGIAEILLRIAAEEEQAVLSVSILPNGDYKVNDLLLNEIPVLQLVERVRNESSASGQKTEDFLKNEEKLREIMGIQHRQHEETPPQNL